MNVRAAALRLLLAFALAAALPGRTGAAGDVPPLPQASQPYTFAPLIDKASPAVVNIYAAKIVRSRSPTQFLDGSAFWRLFRDTFLFGYGRGRIENSLGSGVIVDPRGIIVTNHHVVDAAEGVLVALADGRTFLARLLLSDRRSDIAVLETETPASGLPFLEFGDSDLLKVGDLVLAIGNPFGLGQTVTSGIVSALARTSVGVGDLRFFVQSDAAINPGNSGGAQISLDGKLVGINTAIYSAAAGAQGLGFAVPSNMVKIIVESAVRRQPLVRPWIGVSTRPVPPPIAALAGIPPGRGVWVAEVYGASPAEKAGLTSGDIILAVDDFRVDEPQALRYRIATRNAGADTRLLIARRRSRIEIAVSLMAPPPEPAADETSLSGLSPLAGAKVASLSPALAEDIGLDSGIFGVAVLEVSPGSAADRLGLKAGDVIRSLGDRGIRTVRELLDSRASAVRALAREDTPPGPGPCPRPLADGLTSVPALRGAGKHLNLP